MLTRLGGTRHHHAKFSQNWSIRKAEILQFFNYPNGHRHHLSFLKSRNSLANGVQRIKTHEHVKFWQNRSIGYEDSKIFQFFKVADAAILNFQISKISLADSVWKAQNHNRAKCRQNQSSCCGDIAIFRISKNGRCRHLGFFSIEKFYWLLGLRGQGASACQISSKSVNRLRRY